MKSHPTESARHLQNAPGGPAAALNCGSKRSATLLWRGDNSPEESAVVADALAPQSISFALHFILACFVCLAVAPAVLAQQPSPRLIPFQGRLTDQQGRAYTNGQFTVVFRLYSQAVGGTPLNNWVERHQSVGVINGMINVFLGSITSLDPVDFSQVVHLGITIDADNNSNTADPEMVPRQMIIPAFWAKNSERLAGQDWTPIFGVNSPLGELPASKIQAQGITTDRIATNAITTDKIAPGAVQTTDIGDGQITVEKLAPSFQLDTVIPPGTIQAFGGPNIPDGWLLCDGSALDKENPQFNRLFSAIGTAWGDGSASSAGALYPAILGGPTQTDYNIPDLRGYFLRGVSGTATRDPNKDTRTRPLSGGNPGNLVGSVQSSQTGAHTHGTDTGTDHGSLTAQVWVNGNGNTAARTRAIPTWTATLPRGNGSPLTTADPGTAGARVVGVTANSNPNTTESRPLNAYVHYIIKY